MSDPNDQPKYSGYKPRNGICFIPFKRMFTIPMQSSTESDPTEDQKEEEGPPKDEAKSLTESPQPNGEVKNKRRTFQKQRSLTHLPRPQNNHYQTSHQSRIGRSLSGSELEINSNGLQLSTKEQKIIDTVRNDLKERVLSAKVKKPTSSKIHLNIIVKPTPEPKLDICQENNSKSINLNPKRAIGHKDPVYINCQESKNIGSTNGFAQKSQLKVRGYQSAIKKTPCKIQPIPNKTEASTNNTPSNEVTAKNMSKPANENSKKPRKLNRNQEIGTLISRENVNGLEPAHDVSSKNPTSQVYHGNLILTDYHVLPLSHTHNENSSTMNHHGDQEKTIDGVQKGKPISHNHHLNCNSNDHTGESLSLENNGLYINTVHHTCPITPDHSENSRTHHNPSYQMAFGLKRNTEVEKLIYPTKKDPSTTVNNEKDSCGLQEQVQNVIRKKTGSTDRGQSQFISAGTDELLAQRSSSDLEPRNVRKSTASPTTPRRYNEQKEFFPKPVSIVTKGKLASFGASRSKSLSSLKGQGTRKPLRDIIDIRCQLQDHVHVMPNERHIHSFLRKMEEAKELHRRLHFCDVIVSMTTVARALMSPGEFRMYKDLHSSNDNK